MKRLLIGSMLTMGVLVASEGAKPVATVPAAKAPVSKQAIKDRLEAAAKAKAEAAAAEEKAKAEAEAEVERERRQALQRRDSVQRLSKLYDQLGQGHSTEDINKEGEATERLIALFKNKVDILRAFAGELTSHLGEKSAKDMLFRASQAASIDKLKNGPMHVHESIVLYTYSLRKNYSWDSSLAQWLNDVYQQKPEREADFPMRYSGYTITIEDMIKLFENMIHQVMDLAASEAIDLTDLYESLGGQFADEAAPAVAEEASPAPAELAAEAAPAVAEEAAPAPTEPAIDGDAMLVEESVSQTADAAAEPGADASE